MWGWGNAWGDAGAALMLLVMLVAVALIAVGIVLLVRGTSGRDLLPPSQPQGRPPGTGGQSALHVLEERYARGEIEREDFMQRKLDLLEGREAKR